MPAECAVHEAATVVSAGTKGEKAIRIKDVNMPTSGIGPLEAFSLLLTRPQGTTLCLTPHTQEEAPSCHRRHMECQNMTKATYEKIQLCILE